MQHKYESQNIKRDVDNNSSLTINIQLCYRTEAYMLHKIAEDWKWKEKMSLEHTTCTISQTRTSHKTHGMHSLNAAYARIFILYNFSLKPSSSVSTAENADRTTTFVMLYRNGFADSPEILNGLSNSWNQHQHYQLTFREMGTLVATRKMPFTNTNCSSTVETSQNSTRLITSRLDTFDVSSESCSQSWAYLNCVWTMGIQGT